MWIDEETKDSVTRNLLTFAHGMGEWLECATAHTHRRMRAKRTQWNRWRVNGNGWNWKEDICRHSRSIEFFDISQWNWNMIAIDGMRSQSIVLLPCHTLPFHNVSHNWCMSMTERLVRYQHFAVVERAEREKRRLIAFCATAECVSVDERKIETNLWTLFLLIRRKESLFSLWTEEFESFIDEFHTEFHMLWLVHTHLPIQSFNRILQLKTPRKEKKNIIPVNCRFESIERKNFEMNQRRSDRHTQFGHSFVQMTLIGKAMAGRLSMTLTVCVCDNIIAFHTWTRHRAALSRIGCRFHPDKQLMHSNDITFRFCRSSESVLQTANSCIVAKCHVLNGDDKTP